MKLIAHRGNWQGREHEYENSIPLILRAIAQGFDVEIDVYFINDTWYFGHDYAYHEVPKILIDQLSKYAWFHAKNYNTFCALLQNNCHCFFHDHDDYTLTSQRIIWAYSGKYVSSDYPSIAVMPESTEGFVVPQDIYGVCSDNLMPYIRPNIINH